MSRFNLKQVEIDEQIINIISTYQDKVSFISALMDEDKQYFDLSKSITNILINNLKNILPFKEIVLGFGIVSQKIIPYFLFRVEIDYYRIYLEEVECESCKNKFLIGNPTVMDNFIGLNDELRKIAKLKASLVARYECPVCNTKLKRPYVWTQKI